MAKKDEFKTALKLYRNKKISAACMRRKFNAELLKNEPPKMFVQCGLVAIDSFGKPVRTREGQIDVVTSSKSKRELCTYIPVMVIDARYHHILSRSGILTNEEVINPMRKLRQIRGI